MLLSIALEIRVGISCLSLHLKNPVVSGLQLSTFYMHNKAAASCVVYQQKLIAVTNINFIGMVTSIRKIKFI